MQITLVKRTDSQIEPDTPDALAMRRFLFEMLDGATEKDAKAWRRFIKAMNTAPANSYFVINIERQRSGPFHRLVFAVILKIFKSQEVFADIGIFRQWAKIGCNFVDYVPDLETGELRAIPKSQSFSDCSEDQARQMFEDLCAFFRSPTCCATLWPQTPVETSMQGMLQILSQFDQM